MKTRNFQPGILNIKRTTPGTPRRTGSLGQVVSRGVQLIAVKTHISRSGRKNS